MKFTIYIPMYNAELYIREALNSALRQTFDDYEILIINDGSTDRSCEIVNEYISKHHHIRMVSKNNSGLFHARITAFHSAQGEYVLGLDADDQLQENALETINRIIELNPNVDLVEYCYRRTDFKSGGTFFHKKEATYFNEDINEFYNLVLWSDKYNSQCTKAIKKDIVTHTDEIVDLPRISMGEDKIHTLNYLWRVKNAVVMDAGLYLYRYNTNSMSNKFNVKVFDDLFQIRSAFLRFNVHSNYKLKMDDINNWISIGVAKTLLFTPSTVRDENDKRNYVATVKRLRDKENENSFLYEANVKTIYRVPLILLKKKKYGLLLFLKNIIFRIRKIKDICQMYLVK